MVRRIVLAVLVIAALALLTVSFRSPTSGVLHDAQGVGASALSRSRWRRSGSRGRSATCYGYFSGLASAKSENAKLEARRSRWQALATANVAAAQRAGELEKVVGFQQGPTLSEGLPQRDHNRDLVCERTVRAAGDDRRRHELGHPRRHADRDGGRARRPRDERRSTDTAHVMLLTDPDSSLPARDVTRGISGLIRHGQGNTLILDQVSKELKVKKGDLIVTQGTVDRRYPDLYPYGIPIGEVQSAGEATPRPISRCR